MEAPSERPLRGALSTNNFRMYKRSNVSKENVLDTHSPHYSVLTSNKISRARVMIDGRNKRMDFLLTSTAFNTYKDTLTIKYFNRGGSTHSSYAKTHGERRRAGLVRWL